VTGARPLCHARPKEVIVTDYERTTVRQTVDETVDPAPIAPSRPVDPVVPVAAGSSRATVVRERTTTSPSTMTLIQRVVVLLFGILQALLILRILLLLLVANHDNAIVEAILTITQPFVEPFRGMFSFDKVTSTSTGSVFDMAALVALIGWTLIETLILAVLRLGDRDRATVA
jgi:uncharacterized protein YggT (Ycf19 family)